MKLVKEIFDIFGKNLVSVILFGSYARKNYDQHSDIDLLIIVDEYKEYNLAEFRKLNLINFGRRLDLHVLSKEDVLQNFRDFSPLFVSLILGKKILFDKEMFFKSSFEKFVKTIASENIKYCEGGLVWEIGKIAKSLEILH